MTDSAPIPADEFEAALEALDPEDLVALVTELWAATANDVEVDPPVVTVRNGDARTDLLVAPAASDEIVDGTRAGDAVGLAETADAVVLPPEDSIWNDAETAAERRIAADLETVSPADLRRRLLYALPTADAESLCERFLGVPARSGSYDRGSSTGNDATEDGADETRTAGDQETVGVASAPGSTLPSRAGSGVAAGRMDSDRDAGATSDHDDPSEDVASRGRTPTDGPSRDGHATSRGSGSGVRRDRVALAVVAVVLLAAVAGAASLTGPSLTDGSGDRLDPSDDPQSTSGEASDSSDPSTSDDPQSTDSTDSVDLGDSGTYTGVTDTTGPIDAVEDPDPNGTAAARATALEPTCERTPLHVVQIQMNALRYNDPTTNDGIRTTRRFASPQNRRAVSSFSQFVDLFEGPNYAPMLAHDAARYAPLGIDGDRATVRVVTYENGSATGRYEFRMRKVNATDASLTGYGSGYDGCWMTDAVGVLPIEEVDGTGDSGTGDDSETGDDTVVHGPPGT
ncbi:hypothetical protein SAMN04488066_11725 [Halorubrum aquaticum]|uniref:Uncharacterized protein n=1 Tax=Halorubrum aquaticum TaxID=387340 RepID=A0A1I3C1M5_9EURY|nr:hypothetical protein [Halorubrum aquaticum]SFH67881.1 hypothetical protein SAMN04488066_11725 [Halorubrum aquaticum]